MDIRVQLFAILATGGLLLVILELVRRRRLLERYALLWLFSAAALLALGIWSGLLETIAGWIGVKYAPSALFVIAFAFVLILLLHFSIAVSRLSDQNKVLAQKLAILEARQGDTEHAVAASEPDQEPAPAPRERAFERAEPRS